MPHRLHLDGITIGVFGTDEEAKTTFETSVAKKSEAEGITVFTRSESGRRYSFLDARDYPERIQGYSRIASLVDHALYLYPRSGKLAPPDGELALLLGAFGVPGTLELIDGTSSPKDALAALKGTLVSQYRPESRVANSSSIDLSYAKPRDDFPEKPLVYVDRVFTVKGVGTVALGFVLSGTVSIHDKLRPIPGPSEVRADVKGIQINDVDCESAGRGIRVGLSLRGVEPRDIEKSHWFDDGTLDTGDSATFDFNRAPFYKQEVDSRDLHVQLAGEILPARVSADKAMVSVKMPWAVPVWDGMRGAIIDLNGGPLRVAGGLTGRF